METARIIVEPELAKERLREYRKARAPATAQDKRIMQAYRAVARGKVIIQAHESIRQAGLDDQGRPKLALTRATAKVVRCRVEPNAVEFWPENQWNRRQTINVEWRGVAQHFSNIFQARVPLIPLPLRPKGALDAYHILWEADWHRAPVDPMLLRRLSGDLWLVCAAWDLTDIERAVIES